MPGAQWVPWVVLALGLGTTMTLYGSILRVSGSRRSNDFKIAQKRISNDINAALLRQVSILHATAGLVASNPDIDQKRFTTFYQNLRIDPDGPLPEAIGLSMVRPWSKRGELTDQAANRHVENFHLRPDGPRVEAHAVMLIGPLDDANKAAPGFDMYADPVRRAAMDAARKDDAPAMTSVVYLAKDKGEKIPSFIIYLPVKDPKSGEMIGFVYSGIHASKLFKELLPEPVSDQNPLPKAEEQAGADTGLQGIALKLWSGSRKEENLVFEHSLENEGDPIETPIPLKNLHQSFNATFSASDKFGTQSTIKKFVLPVGSILSLLLFALATNLRRAHEASERRASEQWLIAETGRLTEGGADDDRVLTQVAHAIATTLDVTCRFDLPQEDGSLRWVSTRTENTEALAEIEKERPRLQRDERLIAALSTGQIQRFEGYTPVNEEHRQRLEKLNIGHVVIAPMRAGDHTVGAITITRPKGQPALTDDAVALVEAVVGRMALAIDNGRLYREAQVEIAERRIAEAEVRRLNEGLEEIVAERTRDLEASNHELESFCYSVSHDLRTPLRSLDGFGRALQEDYGERLDEQGLDYIDRIRASTKRMDELITALLTLSRLTRREILPTEVDVTAAVKDLVQDLDPDGKCEFVVEEGLKAQADPRMLGVVFENLLSNAIKFSSRTDHPKIQVGRDGDGSIFVRDNGAGFEMQYGNKLFQPFERLHSVREFPGHGIGLATVERILKRHGGEVRAEGKPGEGATFFVKFPA